MKRAAAGLQNEKCLAFRFINRRRQYKPLRPIDIT